jgi:hypothetical protein
MKTNLLNQITMLGANSRRWIVSSKTLISSQFFIVLLAFLTTVFSSAAQTDVTSSEHQTSRQMAARMKSSEAKSATASFVATKELEKEINSALNEIRVLLTDDNNKTRFETSFAPEMYRKGEQACPSVDLKNLILGGSSFVATTVISDQELKHALDLLKKTLEFLDIK